MASANANRTYALGSLDDPLVVQRRGLPSPSAMGSPGGMGTALPKKTYGMDYSDKFRTGPANYRPGRSIPVGQILAQREGAQAARYADGRPVPKGMPIHVAGYNTSGVGPGTRGYRGSGQIQGYSYENQGTAGTKRSDYSPFFGGLNEFYQNQQQMGDWDRLQGNAAMDQNDAFGSRLAQMSRFAAGQGDMESAEAYSQALQDRAAQQMAAQGGSFGFQGEQLSEDPWAGITSYGRKPVNTDLDPNSPQVQAMLDQAALDAKSPMSSLGNGQFQTPYGKVGSGPSTGSSMFTNAQGSIGPGGVQTNYGGTQTGPQFFQQSADRTQQSNSFASPTNFNKPPQGMSLGDYSRRLMEVKNKLGSR